MSQTAEPQGDPSIPAVPVVDPADTGGRAPDAQPDQGQQDAGQADADDDGDDDDEQ